MRKFVPSPTETVSTGAAVITSYAALVLAQKFMLPLEVTAAAVGVVVGVGRRLVRFLADRVPDKRKRQKP